MHSQYQQFSGDKRDAVRQEIATQSDLQSHLSKLSAESKQLSEAGVKVKEVYSRGSSNWVKYITSYGHHVMDNAR